MHKREKKFSNYQNTRKMKKNLMVILAALLIAGCNRHEINYQAEINACPSVDALMAIWNKYPQLQQDKGFRDVWSLKRGQLESQAK